MNPQAFLDKLIGLSIDLELLKTKSTQEIIKSLNKHDKAILERLYQALGDLDGEYNEANLNKALQLVLEENGGAFKAVSQSVNEQMASIAVAQTTGLYSTYSLEEKVKRVTANQVLAQARARPFQGTLLKEALSNVEKVRADRIRQTIRQGFLEGKTTDEIVRVIYGTKTNKYKDGLLNRSRGDVQRIVRTVLGHTAKAGREAFDEANKDILGVRLWVSTLDGRTSEGCIVRSGLKYTNEERPKPIGHNVPWLGGAGALHWNCRSTWVTLLRGQDKLLGVRASKDGYVDANITFSDWLKRQAKDIKIDLLGKTRADLFDKGEYDLRQFFNERGKLLTLDEFMSKYEPA